MSFPQVGRESSVPQYDGYMNTNHPAGRIHQLKNAVQEGEFCKDKKEAMDHLKMNPNSTVFWTEGANETYVCKFETKDSFGTLDPTQDIKKLKEQFQTQNETQKKIGFRIRQLWQSFKALFSPTQGTPILQNRVAAFVPVLQDQRIPSSPVLQDQRPKVVISDHPKSPRELNQMDPNEIYKDYQPTLQTTASKIAHPNITQSTNPEPRYEQIMVDDPSQFEQILKEKPHQHLIVKSFNKEGLGSFIIQNAPQEGSIQPERIRRDSIKNNEFREELNQQIIQNPPRAWPIDSHQIKP